MSSSIIREIAFSQIKGLTYESAHQLIDRVGSIDAFFDSSTRLLWDKIGSQKSWCTDASREALLKIAEIEHSFCQSNGINAIFMDSDFYPQRCKECNDSPVLLYSLGNCDLNSAHVISIIGTRRATAYGQRFVTDLIASLATNVDNLVIVSGLAYGIDVAAHKGALQAGVPTIGVLAHGLNTIYPADHRDIAARIVKQGGALVTEYGSRANIHKGNFLARNRIVASLSDVTIVVESEEKGGAMVTASIAFDYNREVCAVPGRVNDRYSSGPLKLIMNHKASLIRNADDIINLMNWEKKNSDTNQQTLDFKTQIDDLDSESKKIIQFLRNNPKSTINEIVEALDMSFTTINARLMEMEMNDIVYSLPGQTYTVNI